MQDLPTRILNYFARPGIKSIRPRELAYELKIGKKDFAEFKGAIEHLLGDAKLKLGKNKLLRLVADPTLLAGTIKRSAKGFGHFRPIDPTQIEPDEVLYIAPEDLKDAYTGDEVHVQPLKRRFRGRRCGRVIEVLSRSSKNFVGTYFERRNYGFVRIEGGQFESAISVGDPGAKGAQPEDQVVVEILRFPSSTDAGEAVITKVLGPRGTPGVDLMTIIHEFGLPDEFPDSVLAEARLQAQSFAEEVASIERAGESSSAPPLAPQPSPLSLPSTPPRLDLTHETIITIDPIDARDFDDAISLTREDGGDWRLGVHIADVAHFVRPGTLLDKEAKHRGTSVYLPDKVLPMLPELISNALASLQAGHVRFTKSAFITFSPEGVPLHSEFANSAINVTRRFAYEQVMPLLNDPKPAGSEDDQNVEPHVLELLKRMHELSRILRKRRFDHGALEMDLPEVKIDMDRAGKVDGAHVVSHDESHQIIEEFMLAANVAVAQKLTDCGIDFLRRTHATPDERKLRGLSEFVRSLGYKVRPMPGRGDLQKLLQEVHGTPHEYAVSYAVLRSTKRAEYNPDPEIGHYALAEENYCHFTSPIRRYPDLTVHRLLEQVIGSEELGTRNAERKKKASDHKDSSSPRADLVALGKWCSFTERRADDAENELIKLKMLEYLADRIGEEMDATITGVEKFGFFCQGIELPAEGLVHIRTLPDDIYDYDERARTLVGRRRGRIFRLGGTVRVSVAEVNLVNRTLGFTLVGRENTAKKKPVREDSNRHSKRDRQPRGRKNRKR